MTTGTRSTRRWGRRARQAAFHTILDVTTTEDLKDAAWPLNIDWTEWKSVTIEIMPAGGQPDDRLRLYGQPQLLRQVS